MPPTRELTVTSIAKLCQIVGPEALHEIVEFFQAGLNEAFVEGQQYGLSEGLKNRSSTLLEECQEVAGVLDQLQDYKNANKILCDKNDDLREKLASMETDHP